MPGVDVAAQTAGGAVMWRASQDEGYCPERRWAIVTKEA